MRNSYTVGHYRAVSPAKDTPEQVRERLARRAARERARRDFEAKYPVITPKNVDEALKFIDDRFHHHLFRLYQPIENND